MIGKTQVFKLVLYSVPETWSVLVSVTWLAHLLLTHLAPLPSFTGALSLGRGPGEPLLMAFVSRRLHSAVGPFFVVALCLALTLGAAF